jgi:hypothetical protein
VTSAPTSSSMPIVARRRRLTYENLVDAAFAVLMFAGCISFIEPSPYDLVALIAIPMWFIGGFKINSVQVLISALWLVFLFCGFIALLPYWGEDSARVYQFQSLYLVWTTIAFTLYFGERTLHRSEICLQAFTWGALFSAFLSILSYFNIAGLGVKLITVEGRVSGTFKDPNVFGSYLILGQAFLLQKLLIGKSPRRIVLVIPLALLLIGTFISYSRGSWGSSIFSLAMIGVAAFFTADNRAMRRRILFTAFAFLALIVLMLVIILSQDKIREFFMWRIGSHEYDEGSTGRFGNQAHFLPMLLDLPWGFGPLRFRDYFGLEPHNSYIGAFANEGWLGGLTWILIVGLTTFVGFRLMILRSPFRSLGQIVWPTLCVGLLQGFQIDVDHWRQVYLLFGMVWGFEAARLRWRDRQRTATPPPRIETKANYG